MMLKDEVALVTGASRGIGAEIAAQLAGAGAKVIGTATTADGAARITEKLAAAGGRGAVLNVADQASIDALLADIESKEGAITILCNNAGITRDTLLLRMKQDDWDAVLNTNLSSVFRLSKAVLRGMMKARKGRIISIASALRNSGFFHPMCDLFDEEQRLFLRSNLSAFQRHASCLKHYILPTLFRCLKKHNLSLP